MPAWLALTIALTISGALLGGAFTAGGSLASLNKTIEAFGEKLDDRPTTSEVRNMTTEAVTPLSIAVGKIEGQIRMLEQTLSQRIGRLEDGK